MNDSWNLLIFLVVLCKVTEVEFSIYCQSSLHGEVSLSTPCIALLTAKNDAHKHFLFCPFLWHWEWKIFSQCCCSLPSRREGEKKLASVLRFALMYSSVMLVLNGYLWYMGRSQPCDSPCFWSVVYLPSRFYKFTNYINCS